MAEARGRRGAHLRAGILTALVLAALSLPTVSPFVGEGDAAKFQFVGAALGTPHPTGYPLYTLLGFAASRLLPGLAWAHVANLLSALFAALAGGTIATVAVAGLGVRPVLGAAAGLLFGLAPEVLRQSMVAEVYSLNALLVAGVLGCALVALRGGRPRWLAAAAILQGLALAHHATAILALPALLAAAVASRRRAGAPAIGARAAAGVALVALAAAASPYAYLVERSYAAEVPYLEARADSAARLADTLAGAQFRGNLGRLDAGELGRERLPWLARQALAGGWALLPLGLAGLAGLGPTPRGARAPLALFLVASLAFLLLYTVSDLEAYLVAPFVALALASGPALEAVAQRLDRRPLPRLLAALGLAVLLFLTHTAYDGAEPTAAAAERETSARAALASAPAGAAVLAIGYARGMTLEYARLAPGAPAAAPIAGILVLSRQALGVPFLLGPLRRHLEGTAPLRLPPDDRPLAPGAAVVAAGLDPEARTLLAAAGVEATPTAGGLDRLAAVVTGPPAPPLAFVAAELEPARDPAAAALRLAAPGFDPTRTLLVSGRGPRLRRGGGRARVVAAERDRYLIEVDGEGGWLALQQTLHGRWLARVDGVETPTFGADWGQLALEVQPGPRRVEILRDRRPFALGRWLRSPWGHQLP